MSRPSWSKAVSQKCPGSLKRTYTRSASTAGVEEAKLLNLWRWNGVRGKSFFQWVRPSFASMQRTEIPPLSSPVVVRKTFSPQRTGDEWPPPGNSVFQARFGSVIATGMDLSGLMPVPFGPRKRVHSWPYETHAKANANNKPVFMEL